MKHLPNRKYRPTFFDIMPGSAVLTPELPTFPGAIKLEDIKIGQHLKVINNAKRGGFSWNREAVFTVTDKPFKDHKNVWQLEVVFDRHIEAEHPDMKPGDYKSCCYKEVKAADLGLIPYIDHHWNQDNYCVEYTENDES